MHLKVQTWWTKAAFPWSQNIREWGLKGEKCSVSTERKENLGTDSIGNVSGHSELEQDESLKESILVSLFWALLGVICGPTLALVSSKKLLPWLKSCFSGKKQWQVLPLCLTFHILSQKIELLMSFWGYLSRMQYICSTDLCLLCEHKMNIIIPTLTEKLQHKKGKNNPTATEQQNIPRSLCPAQVTQLEVIPQTSLFQKILTSHLRLDQENKAELSKAKFLPHSSPNSNFVQQNLTLAVIFREFF